MFKIIFYTPESHLEIVKNAMFAAGAGKIGNYSHCAWQTLGEGQFLPLSGSDAYIGELGKLERVQEYKVEMVCDPVYIQQVIQALTATHPYEQPAYFVLRMETL
jgi:structural hemagglutinin/hemolysin toxin protein RtxA